MNNIIIKFRAWDEVAKRMINNTEEDRDYVVSFSGDVKYIKYGSTPFNIRLPQDLILMQFTGLTDKNGVEIFEGDILKFRLFDGATPTQWVVEIPRIYKALKDNENDKVEVIGNIYQNPELLK